MAEGVRVLIAGETWINHFSNIKGRNDYTGAVYYVNPGVIRMQAVMEAHGHEVTHIANHRAMQEFPFSLEEIASYDLVILSDIGADTLQLPAETVNLEDPQRKPDRLRLLGQFVAQGGGLIMVGGWMSFSGFEGKARYHMTPLADVLPVKMLPYDDRVERCDGFSPIVTMPEHPILGDIDEEWPFFLGYQRLLAKETAQVLMEVDGDPFLTVWTYGKGRVAAFASDCGPHWGSKAFLEWQDYGRFWSQLSLWVAGKLGTSRGEAALMGLAGDGNDLPVVSDAE